MRIIVFIWLCCLFSNIPCISQVLPRSIDSLLSQAQKRNTPNSIITAHAKSSYDLLQSGENSDRELELADSLLNFAKEILNDYPNSDTGKMWVDLSTGRIGLTKGINGDSILSYFTSSMKLSRKLKDWYVHQHCETHIISQLNLLGRYEDMIEFSKEGFELYKERKDSLSMINYLSIISSLYSNSGNHELGAKYSLMAYELSQSSNSLAIRLEGGIGLFEIYLISEQLDKAEEIMKKIEEDDWRSAGPIHKLRVYSNKGQLKLKKKEFHSAIGDLNEALALVKITHAVDIIPYLKRHIGAGYIGLKEYADAIQELKESLSYYSPNSNPIDKQKVLKNLAYAYEKTSQTDSAYKYFKDMEEVSRQISETEKQNTILKMEREFQTKLKEERISQLEDEKDTLNTFSQITGLGIFICLVLTLFLGRLYLRQKKQKEIISSQKEILNDQATKLKVQAEERSHFFRNISHELRTPLTLIIGPIKQLLKQEDLDKNTYSLLYTASRHSSEMISLLNQVLNLENREEGKLVPFIKPYLLEPIFDELKAQYASIAVHKKIDLQFELTLNAGVAYELDKYKFLTVLKNLLSNALKYTSAGGFIGLNAEVKNDEIICIISDTGRGIPSSELKRIFDPFYQINSLGQVEGGSGIGLSICKQYMELMGGNIAVRSEWGEGSEFIIKLPIKSSGSQLRHDEDFKALPVLKENASKVPDKKEDESLEKILLVEDNIEVAVFIQNLLSEYYQVDHESNGKEALRYLSSAAKPNIIISDLMMSEIDGLSLLKEVRENADYKMIPFLILTARDNRPDKIQAFRLGVDDYISKPFDPEELIIRVENILLNQKNRTEFVESLEEECDKKEYEGLLSTDDLWLKKLESTILELYSQTDLTISDFAKAMHASIPNFHRKVKAATGMTPMQYVQYIRFQKAREILSNEPDIPIKTLSYLVGFKADKHFSRNFKKRFGKYPSEMKKSTP